ncbi:hypothetical protein AVEN_83153-1 [Araneus ventricosus]|uniref:Uncharacterized protein n=1 Tax=Araneus ventricosus TaxID=182803 RepID=A0A4Y2AME5_ARAVE|nr:hypothetical protein AVEN_83153-1 [Araneus ventricosus]
MEFQLHYTPPLLLAILSTDFATAEDHVLFVYSLPSPVQQPASHAGMCSVENVICRRRHSFDGMSIVSKTRWSVNGFHRCRTAQGKATA